MSQVGTIYGHIQGRLSERSTQGITPLGQRLLLPDGREFRWCKNGGTALSIGRLVQEEAFISGHSVDMVVAAAAAIGATSVTITNNTTAIAANDYRDGFLFVNDAAGEGQIANIKSHPAAIATGNLVLTLEDEDALTVALTTLSQVGLRKNQYKDVIVQPTTVTGEPLGVTPIAVTADYYFWLQTKGPCAVLTNGTLIRGLACVPSATTAGAVDVRPLNSVAGGGQEPVVGIVRTVAASTEYSLVDLKLG